VADDLEAARNYWETQARLKAQTLKGWLGADYPTFEELIFPGDTFDRMSWQQITSTVDNWIASGKSAVLDAMECSCAPDGSTTCPVCSARARMRGEA
jgi:hypothetical protein